MSLERAGPGETLEDEVRALVEGVGFLDEPDGTFEARRARTTLRGTPGEALTWARRNGLGSPARKPGVEASNLATGSGGNRFLERRVGGVYERETRSRMKKLGPGGETVLVVEGEPSEGDDEPKPQRRGAHLGTLTRGDLEVHRGGRIDSHGGEGQVPHEA